MNPSILELFLAPLYRATVCVDSFGYDGPDDCERIVFFNVPPLVEPGVHLEKLLSLAWCVDTRGWVDRGRIYGVEAAEDLLASSYGAAETGELPLFEIGAGGGADEAVGPDQLRYASGHQVDLLVAPVVGERLRQHLETLEAMRIAGPIIRAVSGRSQTQGQGGA